MLDCDLFFHPIRLDNGEAVLQPVLVSEDGKVRLKASKVVTDVEKALSMYAGFTLAAAVELEGGIEGLKEAVDAEKLPEESEED